MEHVAEHNPIKEFIDNHDDHVHAAFDKFKTKHNKQYEQPREHESRKSNFRQNYRCMGIPSLLKIEVRQAIT